MQRSTVLAFFAGFVLSVAVTLVFGPFSSDVPPSGHVVRVSSLDVQPGPERPLVLPEEVGLPSGGSAKMTVGYYNVLDEGIDLAFGMPPTPEDPWRTVLCADDMRVYSFGVVFEPHALAAGESFAYRLIFYDRKGVSSPRLQCELPVYDVRSGEQLQTGSFVLTIRT